jgi:hypothetical protein
MSGRRDFFSSKIFRALHRENFSSEAGVFKNAKQFAFFKYPSNP